MRPRLLTGLYSAAAIAMLGLLVTSCGPRPPSIAATDHSALSTMERIMLNANTCWFKSSDPAFASYQLAPELNSFTGRPRILVVDKKHPTGRPSLVVQAEGNPAQLQAFGPMMSAPPAAALRATSTVGLVARRLAARLMTRGFPLHAETSQPTHDVPSNNQGSLSWTDLSFFRAAPAAANRRCWRRSSDVVTTSSRSRAAASSSRN